MTFDPGLSTLDSRLSTDTIYAKVILPLALPKVYTYSVPPELNDQITIGQRVEVPLRNKLYAGIVYQLINKAPEYKIRAIISLIDDEPIVWEIQLKFWEWLSDYYCCSLGEVMGIALPSGLKLSSETNISLYKDKKTPGFHQLNQKEFLITEALSHRDQMTIEDIRKLLKQKTVYPIVRKMLEQRILVHHEELVDKYKPKIQEFIRLTPEYAEDQDALSKALDMVSKSEKQTRALLSFYQESKLQSEVPKFLIYKKADVDQSVIKAIEKKGIFEIFTRQVDRIQAPSKGQQSQFSLTSVQSEALHLINKIHKEKNTVLLHGVTGSGKTRIYIEMIRNRIRTGLQALYLVPEIALTSQTVRRLQAEFEEQIGFYHSRMSIHERVELWQKVKNGLKVVISARSGLFLPFQSLGLIVVDEEHDGSYKQQDPNPRYNARDAAIYLASLHKTKVVLGTATPSLESLYNSEIKKYGYVQILTRYGMAELPGMDIVDMRIARKDKAVKHHFSAHLIEEIQIRLDKKEQVILFQNRRGYAPTLKCYQCGWYSGCPNCDVGLTVHQYYRELRCHYCGYHSAIQNSCPACGNIHLSMMGFGTEKVEAGLAELFPDARITRMDYDTVHTKHSYEKIIQRMESGRIDILVGTQMITKGLDFDHITLVGILNADALFAFPDFRAAEKAFHLLTQVSGRAGRKEKAGKVLIQTSNPENPVILDVLEGNYNRFVQRELSERKDFIYPPYFRLISVTIKHKTSKTAAKSALFFAYELTQHLGRRVLGPAAPYIGKVRNMYLQHVLVKLEKKPVVLAKTKKFLLEAKDKTQQQEGFKSVRINIDVDPY